MSDLSENNGICYLVGAGPGDPGLLTVKGRDCIEMADVLIYDALSSPKLLKLARPDCELIYAGKRAANHAIPQEKINALCVEKTENGKVVTRLKGGDPLIFGRGGEEAAELAAAGVPFEIVPGLSSGIAGPAYAGIPVTHRDHCSQLTLFTGHEDPTKEETSLDYAHLAKTPGTKVFYMGMSRLAIICEKLIEGGAHPSTPVAIVRWATTAHQQSVSGTLDTIPALAEKHGLKSPAVVVIGNVVNERDIEGINWFENRPLFGKKIVVTRTQAQASKLSNQLSALGAEVIEVPTIKTVPPSDPAALLQSAQDAHRYDWLIFTSPNGVEKFFETYFAHFDDARSLGLARIAAIGPATAAKIREYRFKTDLLPDKHVAEGLVDAFKKESIENQTLLWVKAEETRNVISDELSKLGAIIDTAIAYRTVPESYDEAGEEGHEDPNNPLTLIRERGADYITFTSASTVEHFHSLLNNHDLDWPANHGAPAIPVSIGPITTAALEEAGHQHTQTADTHDIPHLIQTLLRLAST